MQFGSFEKIFAGYVGVITIGLGAFIFARFKIYDDKDKILEAKEELFRSGLSSERATIKYPFFKSEYKDEERRLFAEHEKRLKSRLEQIRTSDTQ